MSATSSPTQHGPSTSGLFHYLDQSVEHSLYRNGKVLSRRDLDGSDSGTEGVDLVEKLMTIQNARLLPSKERRTLAASGFELLTQPHSHTELDFFDHRQVIESYYPDCARIVKEASGASRVFSFDHNIRSAVGKESKRRIAGGQQVQGPAHIVHGDYTLTSAPQRLRDLANPPSVNDTLRSVLPGGQSLLDPDLVKRVVDGDARYAIINLWRSIAEEPVATNPLALCDAQSVTPQDLVVFEIHYHDRIGENYFAKHTPQHQWHYYPAMTRDEVLLIKQWDSAGGFAQSRGAAPDARGDAGSSAEPCTFSFHSAFEDPNTPPDAPDRWSIEVRCVAFYE